MIPLLKVLPDILVDQLSTSCDAGKNFFSRRRHHHHLFALLKLFSYQVIWPNTKRSTWAAESRCFFTVLSIIEERFFHAWPHLLRPKLKWSFWDGDQNRELILRVILTRFNHFICLLRLRRRHLARVNRSDFSISAIFQSPLLIDGFFRCIDRGARTETNFGMGLKKFSILKSIVTWRFNWFLLINF